VSELKILTKRVGLPDSVKIDTYLANEGYAALAKVLKEMTPSEVIDEVKTSKLRGRGGAGFATGLKWDFASQSKAKPKFVVCNADEGEPGTFKDRVFIEFDPHAILEGMAIAARAIDADHGYIYIRGEYPEGTRILEEAIKEAEERGYLGDDILGTGFSFTITVHRGAGAYVCGEETALIDSLEGKRGQSRIRPPFPVVAGYRQLPTCVNNVETLSSVPHIILNGGEWYAAIGAPGNPGPKLFSISGHVEKPGVYETPTGISLRELIETAGGMKDGKAFKAAFPGGASSNCMDASEIDTGMDFDSLSEIGTMLGSGAVMILDETTDMVKAAYVLTRFFDHECCGKCTPCREGLYWVKQVMAGILEGKGTEEDLDMLLDVCEQIQGASFCGLGDAAVNCVTSTIRKFRGEYLNYIKKGAGVSAASGESS
jgi:NADH-quinone oxidoreductase subunit F